MSERKAYFSGAGLASLAGAVFLIRDANMPGKNIHIFEELGISGGSCDGIGSKEKGYVIRGGRMLNYPAYECTWQLMEFIPSLTDENRSCMDEILDFNEKIKTRSGARLVNKDGKIEDVTTMGFNSEDRKQLMKFALTSEESLGIKKIDECFGSHFFTTKFWFMWATTFAFQPWHSAVEFKRYMQRFMHEFPRIQTLEGVARTPYNQYDSMILPTQRWLEKQGVQIHYETCVKDVFFNSNASERSVNKIMIERKGKEETVNVSEDDLVFITNGSMTENSSLGSMNSAPEILGKGSSFKLWEKIVEKEPDLGNPEAFAGNVPESLWESFTVTCKDPIFFDLMEQFSGNKEGTGALVTFKDSNWLMSLVLAYQPHFINQPEHIKVFWGYALFPEREGDYVKKKMSECTGEEIMIELMNHLNFTEHKEKILSNCDCIPCMMPFITSHFMPRKLEDRPPVVPERSKNCAFLGQFCEIPDDVVFTVEYSIRSAQMAVYDLLNINKRIPPISRHDKNIGILAQSFGTMFR